MFLAPFMAYLKANDMALSWSHNGSFKHHFIDITLYTLCMAVMAPAESHFGASAGTKQGPREFKRY